MDCNIIGTNKRKIENVDWYMAIYIYYIIKAQKNAYEVDHISLSKHFFKGVMAELGNLGDGWKELI